MGLTGMRSVKRKVRGVRDNLRENTLDAVEDTASDAARAMQGKIVQHNTVYTTNLYRSIGVQRRGMNRVTITADVPYAAFVEFGTGINADPSTPPKFLADAPPLTGKLIRNIKAWVMNKPAFYGPRTEATAYKIAAHIAERGTEPHPFMRPVWHQYERNVVQSAESAVKRTVRRA